MVEYANEVRGLFMGAGDITSNSIEVTFSTRSLLRWGELTQRFQPLARQGIQPITYALDRALAFRATPETRTGLHELAQRHFPRHEPAHTNRNRNDHPDISGDEAVNYLSAGLESTTVSIPSVYLEKRNYKPDNSGCKFWEGEARADGMRLKYGASGTNGAQKEYPADTCIYSDPRKELLARAAKKLREGYVLVLNKSTF